MRSLEDYPSQMAHSSTHLQAILDKIIDFPQTLRKYPAELAQMKEAGNIAGAYAVRCQLLADLNTLARYGSLVKESLTIVYAEVQDEELFLEHLQCLHSLLLQHSKALTFHDVRRIIGHLSYINVIAHQVWSPTTLVVKDILDFLGTLHENTDLYPLRIDGRVTDAPPCPFCLHTPVIPSRNPALTSNVLRLLHELKEHSQHLSVELRKDYIACVSKIALTVREE